jgi:Na+/melibiose symporter-like transporter
MTDRLPKRDLFAYGGLALPVAFAGLPLYIHAPDYYATEFGISLGAIGVVLLMLRLFDAVQDPLIGTLSDRFAAHRLKIMVGAAAVLVASFAALFQPLGPPLLWFGVMMLLATSAYSVLSISLNADGAVWSRDEDEKTRIVSIREAFGLIGLMLAVTAPGVLSQSMPAPSAFGWVSVMLLVFMAAAMLPFAGWRRRNPLGTQPVSASGSLLTILRTASPDTRWFFLVYGVSMLASSIPALLILFFIRDRLDAEAYAGLFLLTYFIAGAIGTALWRWVSVRTGKSRAWAISMGMAIVSFIWASLLGAGDIIPFVIICAVSGITFGADLVLPPSILADRLQLETREDRAAAHFGVLAFEAKAALALGSAIVLPALGAIGFVPAGENDRTALIALSLAYAAIPCLIKIIALVLLWRGPRGNAALHAS